MPFAPTDYNGLVFWLKADALALANNDPVSSWTDSSGNARHAVQATGASQPLYKTGILNAQPALLFDGINDGLQIPAIDLTNAEALTLFLVCQPVGVPTLTAAQVVLESSANIGLGASVTGAVAVTLLGPDPFYQLGVQNGSGAGLFDAWGKRAVAGTPNLIELRNVMTLARSQVSGAVDGDWRGQYSTDVKRTLGSRTLGNHAWNIGARNNAASAWFSGYVCEVIVYRKALGYDRAQAVRDYLATKYALTLAATGGIWVMDGYSHTDGDSLAEPRPKLRWWDRCLQRLTQSIEPHLSARGGQPADRFANDMLGSDRYLETTAVTPRLLTTDGIGNDLYYRSIASFDSYAKSLLNGQNDLARVAASNATARAITNQIDNNGAAKPVNWDADILTYNTWLATAGNRPNVDLIDYAAITPFAPNAGTNANDATWFDTDHIHVTNSPGMTRQANVAWMPWLVSKGFVGFTPAALAVAPALWFDASAITGKVNNDPISSWTDLSGNAKHAVQATGSKQPLYQTNVLGYPGGLTLPAVLFDGVDDFLTTPSVNLSATSAVTVFVVAYSTTATTFQVLFSTPDALATAGALAVYKVNTSRLVTHYHKGNVGATSLATLALSTTPVLACAINDMAASAANLEVTARANGTQYQTSAGSNNTGAFTTGATYLGAESAGAASFLAGAIAEFILLPYKATLREYRQIEAYLRDKWVIF
jgi:hypothetical protein